MGKRFWGVAGGLLVWLAFAAGPASADQFTITFDDAVINTGGVTSSQAPGVNRHNDVWQEPVNVASFSGTVTEDGSVRIPGEGVRFDRQTRTIQPYTSFYTIDWRSPDGFEGTFDAETGKLVLTGTLEQTITQLSNSCTTGPITVTLSTENQTNAATGERFTEGLAGEGKLVGSWSTLFLETTGPDCDADALACYARADLAQKRGNLGLSTKPDLPTGAPSMSQCESNLRLKEIVYSHDGRITVSAPDGARRTEITHPGEFLEFPAEDGDDQPVLSPESKLVAFVRNASPLWPDGSSLLVYDRLLDKFRTLAKSDDYEAGFRSPVFDPDRIHLFYVRTGENPGVIRTELNGKGQINVAAGIPSHPDLGFSDIDLSADGRQLLVGMEGYRERDGHPIARIYRVDLATGKAKLLQTNASNGAYSPDGRTIVFESLRDRIGFSCFKGYCSARSRIYTMNADGSGVRRLFRKAGQHDEASPDFSPDGARITFTSDRSGIEQLHIAKPDGSCLGSLTNGNLPSYSASWGSGFESEGAPAVCGNRNLEPRIELNRVPGPPIHGLPRLWLGSTYRGNSLYWPAGFNGHSDLEYAACVRFSFGDCDRSVNVVTYNVCGSYPGKYPSYATRFFTGAVRYRGAVVEFYGPEGSKRASTAVVFTGGRIVYIDFYSPNPNGSARPLKWYFPVIDQLRPLWQEEPESGKLPGPRMGRNALGHYKRMLRFSQSHSLARTAKRFKQNRRSVLYSVRAAKRYVKLGMKPIACERS